MLCTKNYCFIIGRIYNKVGEQCEKYFSSLFMLQADSGGMEIFMYDYVNGSEKILEEYNIIGLLDLFKDNSLR